MPKVSDGLEPTLRRVRVAGAAGAGRCGLHLASSRASTLMLLDESFATRMSRIVRRTLCRRLRRIELWNGHVEPPLPAIFGDERMRRSGPGRTCPNLPAVRPSLPAEAEEWSENLGELR